VKREKELLLGTLRIATEKKKPIISGRQTLKGLRKQAGAEEEIAPSKGASNW